MGDRSPDPPTWDEMRELLGDDSLGDGAYADPHGLALDTTEPRKRVCIFSRDSSEGEVVAGTASLQDIFHDGQQLLESNDQISGSVVRSVSSLCQHPYIADDPKRMDFCEIIRSLEERSTVQQTQDFKHENMPAQETVEGPPARAKEDDSTEKNKASDEMVSQSPADQKQDEMDEDISLDAIVGARCVLNVCAVRFELCVPSPRFCQPYLVAPSLNSSSNFRTCVFGENRTLREALALLFPGLTLKEQECNLHYCKSCAVASGEDLYLIRLHLSATSAHWIIAIYRFTRNGVLEDELLPVKEEDLSDLSVRIAADEGASAQRTQRKQKAEEWPSYKRAKAMARELQFQLGARHKLVLHMQHDEIQEAAAAVPCVGADFEMGASTFAPCHEDFSFRSMLARFGGGRKCKCNKRPCSQHKRVYSRKAAEDHYDTYDYNWALIFVLSFVTVEKQVAESKFLKAVGLGRCSIPGMSLLVLALLEKLKTRIHLVTSGEHRRLMQLKIRDAESIFNSLPSIIDALSTELESHEGVGSKNVPSSRP